MRRIEKRIISTVSRMFRLKDKCPVIYYHDIVPDGQGDSYQKTEVSIFEKQIECISKIGIRTYTFNDISDDPQILNHAGNCVICFDDGYLSNYEVAYPIFKKYDVKFNIFIEGKAVKERNKNYVSEEQIQEMYNSGLAGFGAHTWNHIDCMHLSDINYNTEVADENRYLSSILKVDHITDFCFPYGNYSESILKYLGNKNVYERLYTSDNRKPAKFGNCVVLGRIAIENNDTDFEFKEKIQGRFAAYRLFKPIIDLIRK